MLLILMWTKSHYIFVLESKVKIVCEDFKVLVYNLNACVHKQHVFVVLFLVCGVELTHFNNNLIDIVICG